jgi:hypothetical protein
MKMKDLLLTVLLILMMFPLLNGVDIAQEQGPQVPVTATPAPALLAGLADGEPLSQAAINDCPVSLPNLSESPDEYYMSVDRGYGNPEGTLFIGLWPGGKVIFYPDGSGSRDPDGSLSMKFWFYRTVPGEVVIEGRRLDASEPVARLATLRGRADGYGETGFHPAGLRFPGQGCWEVMSSVGEERMTFVTLVVWIAFHPLWPQWLPESITLNDVDLTDYPLKIDYIFLDPEEGILTVGTTDGVSEDTQEEPGIERHLFVQDQQVRCADGAWEGRNWDADADGAVLRWEDDDLSYSISQQKLGLSCTDLLKVSNLSEMDRQ